MNAQLGATRHSVAKLESRLSDLTKIEQTCADTEKFLGFVLPIRTQYSIYKNI